MNKQKSQDKRSLHSQKLAEKRANKEKSKKIGEIAAYVVAGLAVIGFVLLLVFSYT